MLLLDSIILILVMMAPIGIIAGLSLYMDGSGHPDTEEYIPRSGMY